MKVEYGLLEIIFTDEEDVKCRDNTCDRRVYTNSTCFVDTSNNDIYCSQCGKCLKYQRKKEQQRKDMGIVDTPLIKGLDY